MGRTSIDRDDAIYEQSSSVECDVSLIKIGINKKTNCFTLVEMA